MKDPFIDKVRQIILDHLDDEKFSVSELASEIGLSKSQTFRKIKSLTNKSVSQIINETRLQEAAKLILKTDLHASEISYKVGFSSPSYFNRCFRKYYGITPGEYKENPLIKTFDQSTSRFAVKKLQFALYILGASLLFFVSISIVKKIINPPKISIAVLYFDDHSPRSNKQWLCNQITEEITDKLFEINRLKVSSRTSVKQFRNSDQSSISEIIKALDVDYFIEGSVTMVNNKDKITIQLIGANNEHIWSDVYEDISAVQQHVAKEIAQELKIELSLEEEIKLTNNSPVNLEAYQLFTEGVSFSDLRDKEGLIKSNELFQKVIDLDPNYAEAYAEMAANYLMMFFYHIDGNMISSENGINFNKIYKLLDRAININPNTVRVYTTMGMIFAYQKNWEKAKENYDNALERNPNDAITQYYYSLYFTYVPEVDYKKALEHINFAQKLKPYSKSINSNKIYFLLRNDKLEDAEEFYNQNNSFFTEETKLSMQLDFIAYEARKRSVEKKDWKEAIKIYLKSIEEHPNNFEINRLLALTYKEILNNDSYYLKYAKILYNLDSFKNKRNVYPYYNSLLENKNYKKAKELLQNENFQSLFIGEGELKNLFYWYYYQGDYKNAHIQLNKNQYDIQFELSIVLAQQNKVKETYTALNTDVLMYFEKAIVFAILKDRDSMYYYMNKEKDIYRIRKFNGFNEVDPYRKEERYKAFLKKNYLPITH